ncbi:hypothetical protein evm_013815 [Chilo suppressalis]|nr:hypothetical protein evm_013815 [Chilo suppressalis]
MNEAIYICKHCNSLIESFNDAGNHQYFREKELIYQDEEDNTILFVHNYENENKENHEKQVFNNEEPELHNSSLSDAVWTKQDTMAMLSLYEANIQRLMDIGKKSRVWKKISKGLKDLCIQVTTDQVK